MSREFWEQRYGERPQIWSGRPNAQLVAVLSGATPGSALDLGCGEGGDAIWLAGQGWQVTAVDIAQTAIDRARGAAEQAGLGDRIRFERHDLTADMPTGPFDLVSAQFLQSPIELPREEVLQRAAARVRSGGLLLIVDHGAPPPGSHHAHAHPLPTAEETYASLGLDRAEWEVLLLEVREREGIRPDGEAATFTDNVIELRRR